MNFFAQQAQARSQTRYLLLMCILSVLAVVALIDCVLWIALLRELPSAQLYTVLTLATLLILAVIGCASLYKILSLREGGAAVARTLGGVRVGQDTNDASYRRLKNVVDEMAIAAGVVCPEIYVLEQEAAINAFASGFSATDAAVTVTRGALDKLSRDELQGVIAHEFSHILNGDMRLNMRLLGAIFGLMVLGMVGREILYLSPRGKDRSQLLLVGLALMVLGFAGLFFGRLIKAAISRTREFNADATAVQFTRMPSGIAGALKKVGGFQSGSKLKHRKTEEVDHMLFADGEGFGRMLATHPNLAERIARLDPNFRVEQLQSLANLERNQIGAALQLSEEPSSAAQMLGLAADQLMPVSSDDRASLLTAQVLVHVANPEQPHVEYARKLRRGWAPLLTQAAHSRSHAASLILALVLVNEDATEAGAALEAQTQQSRQLAIISRQLGLARLQGVTALIPSMYGLPREYKLPLACVAFPTFKASSDAELSLLLGALNAMVEIDGRVDLFEYCLVKLISNLINDASMPTRAARIGREKLASFPKQLSCVFSTLAAQGHVDPAQAQAAFTAGCATLNLNATLKYASEVDFTQEFDVSLNALDALAPFAKRQLIGALLTTLSFDGKVATSEAELLRVICLTLHCPLPPLLETYASEGSLK